MTRLLPSRFYLVILPLCSSLLLLLVACGDAPVGLTAALTTNVTTISSTQAATPQVLTTPNSTIAVITKTPTTASASSTPITSSPAITSLPGNSAVTNGQISLKLRTSTAPFPGHSSGVRAVAYSPDGKILASGGHDHTIKLWDSTTNKELKTLYGHSNWVNALAFNSDGKMLASVGYDGTARLWDVASGSLLKTFTYAKITNFTSIAFNPDGKTIVVGTSQGSATVWDLVSSKQTGNLQLNTQVAFSPDGKTLAEDSFSNNNDGKQVVHLIQTTDHKLVASLQLPGTGSVTELAYSPDGKYLAVATEAGAKIGN